MPRKGKESKENSLLKLFVKSNRVTFSVPMIYVKTSAPKGVNGSVTFKHSYRTTDRPGARLTIQTDRPCHSEVILPTELQLHIMEV